MLKQQYTDIIQFYKQNLKKYVITTSVVFIALIIVSYFVFKENPDIVKEYLTILQKTFDAKNIIGEDGSIDVLLLIWNNIVACLYGIVLGIIPFLFLPLLSLSLNAVIIGLVMAVSSLNGIGLFPVFVGIIPHGIFEIPALILSMTLGIYLCKEVILKLLGRQKEVKLGFVISNISKIYVFIIFPLIIIAGFIEAFITPVLLNSI